ncbi:hypothetical protein [Aquimarina sp. 2201CG5-10]|uniref:hypothetical protein n=1 Tax=Aquimarina callyspongiae TaxID=3098150 RepID=UPI002AB5086D|nr:hypothetical protein [Aquimarina sp. 2201CG5-10]MDY8138152.1 hypothetical protein [Aquimarina sp. 2201CG5-10]
MDKLLWFFQRFSIWFKILLGELFNNLISLFLILAVYFALWHFPQTIDLLLILNQSDAFLFEVPLYFSLLVISAFLIWNVPKYFYYHNYKDISLSNLIGFIPNQHYKFQNKPNTVKYPYMVRIHMRKTIPRILGTLLLAISALGILHAMELFELENTYTDVLDPENTLLICIFLLLLMTEPKLYGKLQGYIKKIPMKNVIIFALSIGLIILIISLGTLNTQAEKDLGKLFISNCALTLLFFTLSFNSYSFLKKVSKRKFYGIILISGFALLILFFLLNFIPKWASAINPLSVMILSLCSLFMISFILILWGKKLKLPLFSIITIISIFSASYFSTNSNHYELTLKTSEVHRPPMDEYMFYWIKNRKALIENRETPFPIIIVSAEGGGSRAGLWSFLVHSYLYEKSNGRYFKENLLSLTGASGGTVGNAMFFAEAQNASLLNKKAEFELNPDNNGLSLKYKASAIYKENYLSEALLSMLGRDLFKDITNLFKFKNRGQLLEEQWSNAHNKYFGLQEEKSLLNKEFLSYYRKTPMISDKNTNQNTPPLLLINTTHTQTGNYNIISPVTYKHLAPLEGLNDFLKDIQLENYNRSISLSTAMRINASFPFITPVGEIKNSRVNKLQSDQYADSGYYDNIGGTVSKGLEEVFLRVLNDSFPDLKEKVVIKHLMITNNEDRKITKTQAQLAAPLTTLQNVRYGHTQEIMKKLGDKYIVKLKPTVIRPALPSVIAKKSNDDELLIKPVLPLGRYLSTVAIQSVEARLKEVSKQLDLILETN